MSLQARLDAFETDFRSGKPPFNAPASVHPIMERATAEQVSSGAAVRALRMGDTAPAFTLNDSEGTPTAMPCTCRPGHGPNSMLQ